MDIGRNELCPCGSGKKYKKCCMKKEKNTITKEYINEEDIEEIYDFVKNFHYFILKNKPHIKKYEKIRKLHGEIIDSMMKYYDDGKFKWKVLTENIEEKILKSKDLEYIYSTFDTRTELGAQAMANIIIYKNSEDMNCITEEYIKNKRFRKPEKVEFLNVMLNSEAGLFEITRTDRENGQVDLKNVLTNKEICITDIGLSGNLSNEEYYFYTRIITYDNISFGTGLNIIFSKEDKFIKKWIQKNKKEYNKLQELNRFLELYNEYARDDKGFKSKLNNL